MHILNNVFIMSDTSRVFAKFHDFFLHTMKAEEEEKNLIIDFLSFLLKQKFFASLFRTKGFLNC